jgi:N-acetylglucosamine-6-phosphate deacetylase
MEIKIKYLNGVEPAILRIADGIIQEILPFSGSEFDYHTVGPALVDVHINGGEEFHFTANPTPETLEDIERSGAKNGVGYLLPALITSQPETLFKGIEAVKLYRREKPNSGIIGIHLEGPFIAVEKRGAHLTRFIRKPNDTDLREIITALDGTPAMITLAPEHFTDAQIRTLLQAGIHVSLGHSNCTFERANEAFDLGVKWITHLFNAMSSFQHRLPGLAGAALLRPEVYTPIIPDGVHVHLKSVALALEMKKEKLLFISDALFQNGKKTSFRWEEFDAQLIDGNYINADGNLAGATISMADALEAGTKEFGMSVEESFRRCAEIPGEALRLNIGKIKPGYPAKFITFGEDFSEIRLLDFT